MHQAKQLACSDCSHNFDCTRSLYQQHLTHASLQRALSRLVRLVRQAAVLLDTQEKKVNAEVPRQLL
jgi:hypothetical protein